MRIRAPMLTGSALLGVLLFSATAIAAEPKKELSGKDLAYNSSMGNCLACHAMPTQEDAIAAGNSGPPLIAMSARFPNKADLRAQIYDATVRNPDSFMPPFGKHKALTDAELDKIVEFVYGL